MNYRDHIKRLFASTGESLSWTEIVNKTQGLKTKGIKDLRRELLALVLEGYVERKSFDEFEYVSDSQRLGSGAVTPFNSSGQRRQTIGSRKDGPIIGFLMEKKGKLVVATLRSDPAREFRIIGLPGKAVIGDLVRFNLVHDPSGNDVAKFVSFIEGQTDIELKAIAISEELNIPTIWPEEASLFFQTAELGDDSRDSSARRDMRNLPFVTIDAEDAKDFDDAVFAEFLESDKVWRLVVAISDVSAYLSCGTPLDDEARRRGTSVYFPGLVFPMLPEALSNGICSLQPGKDRLSLVVDVKITSDGRIQSFTFYEAIIRSRARLTYEEVQQYIDEKGNSSLEALLGEDQLKSLDDLIGVYEALMIHRESRGALDFQTREGKPILDGSKVKGFRIVKRLMAHKIIEESMICANVCAAKLIEESEILALFRIHEPPAISKLFDLQNFHAFADHFGPEKEIETSDIKALLEALPETEEGDVFERLVLRSMSQAAYEPSRKGHFGLALERYLHFTSPIRRYPDITIHRKIKSILEHQNLEKDDKEQLIELGRDCSRLERRAEKAERMLSDWIKCELAERQVGKKIIGTIVSVTEFGLFIELDGYFVDGLLHVSQLGQDYFMFDKKKMSLVGSRSGEEYVLGQKLEVRVVDIQSPRGRISLDLPKKGTANWRRKKK
jgi:ribonuclease R